jgi:23S rRNA (guanosine2251-2'-O)-methyltransferase
MSADKLSRLVGGERSHQGVVLLVASALKAPVNLEQLLKETRGKRLFLLLDGVTDPGNLGACLRSAASLGVDAVIAPKNASAPVNADAIKRSSGGAEQVPYIQVVNLARCMEQLKSAGVWVVGTALDAVQPISDIDLNDHIAIVMGSEGKGIRPNTRKHCDFLARIPMVNESLGFNVSVATGICLYEVNRQRLHP